jgi:predicted metal-binding membrane protein
MQEKEKRCTCGGCGVALLFLLVCVGLIVVVYLNTADEDPALQVFVKQGVLRGRHLTTRKGRLILAFQGIPYAKPPVGDLRFRVCTVYLFQ